MSYKCYTKIKVTRSKYHKKIKITRKGCKDRKKSHKRCNYGYDFGGYYY